MLVVGGGPVDCDIVEVTVDAEKCEERKRAGHERVPEHFDIADVSAG